MENKGREQSESIRPGAARRPTGGAVQGNQQEAFYVKGMNIYQVGIGFRGNAVRGFFSELGLAPPSHWAGTFLAIFNSQSHRGTGRCDF